MRVEDICTRELVMADKDASLQQAAELMREHHVGTLLVVAHGADALQALGIVSLDDLLDALAHELSGIARVARAGIEREAAERAPLPRPAPLPPTVRVPAYSYV